MDEDLISQEQLFAVIKNQIVSSYPPETKIAFSRLTGLGYNEVDTNKMIGKCLYIELVDALKHKKEFDRDRYKQNLDLLPQLPAEYKFGL